MDYKKNARDEKNDGTAKENDERYDKDGSRDREDNDAVKEKNKAESKVSNINNLFLNPNLKVFINIIMQLNLGYIIDIQLLGKLSTYYLCLVNTTPAFANLIPFFSNIDPFNVVTRSFFFWQKSHLFHC